MALIGVDPSMLPHPWVGAAQPAPITNTAPSVGNSAAMPGYIVVPLNWVQAHKITPSPTHPVTAAARGDSRRHCPAVRASGPPIANYQARGGSEKNAIGAI